jgi:hypothetical protein
MFCCLFFIAGRTGAWAKDKEPKTYPEMGTIIARRTQEQTTTTPVYTDPQGKTWGGVSGIRRLPVYRIETDTKFYELEGRNKRHTLTLSDPIRFRLEKEWAYVQLGNKEDRFRVVTVELKPTK